MLCGVTLQREWLQLHRNLRIDSLYYDFQIYPWHRAPNTIGSTEEGGDNLLDLPVPSWTCTREPEVCAVPQPVLPGLENPGCVNVSARQIADNFPLRGAPKTSPKMNVPVRRPVDTQVASGEVPHGPVS